MWMVFFHPFSHGHPWDFPMRKGFSAPGLWLQTVRCLSPLPLEVISTWSTTRPGPGCGPGWRVSEFSAWAFLVFSLKMAMTSWHEMISIDDLANWWSSDSHLMIMKSLDFTSVLVIFSNICTWFPWIYGTSLLGNMIRNDKNPWIWDQSRAKSEKPLVSFEGGYFTAISFDFLSRCPEKDATNLGNFFILKSKKLWWRFDSLNWIHHL